MLYIESISLKCLFFAFQISCERCLPNVLLSADVRSCFLRSNRPFPSCEIDFCDVLVLFYLVTGSFAPPLGKSQMSIEVKWPSTNYMERGGSGFVDLYPCISSVSHLPASQTQAVRDIFPPNLFLGVARIPTSPPNLSCVHRTTCRKLICNHNVCKYAP